MHVVVFSGNAFLVRSVFCLTEFTRTDLCLVAPVGPQDIEHRQYNTKYSHRLYLHHLHNAVTQHYDQYVCLHYRPGMVCIHHLTCLLHTHACCICQHVVRNSTMVSDIKTCFEAWLVLWSVTSNLL